jgi:site-specific DNA-methyltransferase (adenine-specific)
MRTDSIRLSDEFIKRTYGYITKDIIKDKHNAIDKYKLFFTTSYSSNATVPPEPIKGLPNEICTETFLLIGPFKNKEEMENCYKYLHTNFFRFLLYYGHGTMQVNKEVFTYIPLVDFSKEWDDEKLYNEFNITDKKDIEYIESILK